MSDTTEPQFLIDVWVGPQSFERLSGGWVEVDAVRFVECADGTYELHVVQSLAQAAEAGIAAVIDYGPVSP